MILNFERKTKVEEVINIEKPSEKIIKGKNVIDNWKTWLHRKTKEFNDNWK